MSFCPADGTALEAEDPYVGQELLGQFRIERRIGSGGMGVVYRAHQRGVERKVAIKVLHRELTDNADAVQRFQREAKVAASIDHPNVVRILLYGELPDGNGYIAMEFLEGRALSDVINEEGPLAVARAVHIVEQICAAVGEAHAHSIVHRDIKPENVLLVTRGAEAEFVKVVDFGVARLLQGEGSVTQTGLVFGTAHYISPEGARGEPTDARSDVYSIAALFYQLLTGERLFDGPTPVAVMLKHIHEPAQDVRMHRNAEQTPEPIAAVIARGLSKDAAHRFADAKKMREALGLAAAVAGIDGRSSRTTPRVARTSIASAISHANELERTREAQHDSSMSAADWLSANKKSSPITKAVVAFLASAAIAFGVAGAYRSAVSRAHDKRVDAIVRQAEQAIARDAIDAPPESSAVYFISELRRRAPDDERIATLRDRASERLRQSASRAMDEDLLDEARRDYERALAIVPTDRAAQEGLARVNAKNAARVSALAARTERTPPLAPNRASQGRATRPRTSNRTTPFNQEPTRESAPSSPPPSGPLNEWTSPARDPVPVPPQAIDWNVPE